MEAFWLEGATAKPEAIRGVENILRFWPRREGRVATPDATPTIEVLSPQGTSLATPTATGPADDGSYSFPWTPGASLDLDEDYFYTVAYAEGAAPVREVVYFDLCLRPLACPVDDNVLAAMEPSFPRYLTAAGLADGGQFILAAWDDVLSRVRTAGFRPALLTDRHTFARPAAARALELAFLSMIKAPGDTADRKRELWGGQFEALWAKVGPLKFTDALTATGEVAGSASALPRFHV